MPVEMRKRRQYRRAVPREEPVPIAAARQRRCVRPLSPLMLIANHIRRGRVPWTWPDLCTLLIRWDGERLPYPMLDGSGARKAEVVGLAAAGTETIVTFPGVAWAADTIYHLAAVAVAYGGMSAAIQPLEIRTRVTDATGALRGWLPAAPSSIAVRCLSGGLPLVTWVHSRAGAEVPPASFQVFVSTGAAFDFATAAGTVEYVRGQTGYSWVGAGLTAGDQRWYTVRSVSAGGVLSVIPRTGLCPSGDYGAVELGRCPKLILPVASVPTPPACYAEFVQ